MFESLPEKCLLCNYCKQLLQWVEAAVKRCFAHSALPTRGFGSKGRDVGMDRLQSVLICRKRDLGSVSGRGWSRVGVTGALHTVAI